MREGVGFNWRTGTVLVLLILGFWAYQFRDLFTVYEQLKSNMSVNDELTLYITQAASSSLSKDTYRYYLYDAKKSPDDFMAHVKDVKPIMITDDYEANAEVKDRQIYLHVRGNIYSFRNVGYSVRIHLDVAPY
ncbi:hypothetical protein [Pseudescherichia vulneris]|uniref:hypothetical protein n=1 Tax=Pseudescherichia vulneris TaxID=566 RepID=UPI00301A682A